jgi:tetratricopeptide (TPR) repeat protein
VTRRLPLAVAALVTICLAAPAAAQSARALGIVRDTDGHAVRSAIVRATNPNGHPAEVTSSTDAKGRWAMIGLSSGEWRFAVEAPGFVPNGATVVVRIAGTPPMAFTLARDPGPLPGALDKNIMQELAAANALREQGRYEQAIAAYTDIHSKNPKLTSIHLVLADAYRQKAAHEQEPAARQALLNLALNSYSEMLKDDASNDRARAGVESTRTELAATNGSKE